MLDTEKLKRKRKTPDKDPVAEEQPSVTAGTIEKVVDYAFNPSREKIREMTYINRIQGMQFPQMDAINAVRVNCIAIAQYREDMEEHMRAFDTPKPVMPLPPIKPVTVKYGPLKYWLWGEPAHRKEPATEEIAQYDEELERYNKEVSEYPGLFDKYMGALKKHVFKFDGVQPEIPNLMDELLFRIAQWAKSVGGQNLEKATEIALAEVEGSYEEDKWFGKGRDPWQA